MKIYIVYGCDVTYDEDSWTEEDDEYNVVCDVSHITQLEELDLIYVGENEIDATMARLQGKRDKKEALTIECWEDGSLVWRKD